MAKNTSPPPLLDEYDAYGRVFAENTRYRRREMFFYWPIILVFVVLFVIAALRPPMVIVKDRAIPPKAPALIRPGDKPPVTAEDVRAYLYYLILRRWGWSSSSKTLRVCPPAATTTPCWA